MNRTTSNTEAELTVVGIDIGKDVFHLRRLRRDRQDRLPTQDPAFGAGGDLQDPSGLHRRDGGMPGGAHFVARTLRRLGHDPRIIPAKYAKPFAKGQKNDYNDAEAIAEAALRPNLRWCGRRRRTNSTCRPITPHPVAAGLAPDRDGQSDPGVPDRTGYRHPPLACGPFAPRSSTS